ncbi:MAG: type 1 glutamine amidotransferase [Dehalococcoidia bacterium]
MTDQPRTIRVVTLYPDVMSIYADRGNLIALRARCRQYGIACEVTASGIGDELPADADLVFIGGGQDQEQRRIASDLAAKGVRLRDWAEDDVAMLTVCGGFQLFGHFYRTAEGEELPGVGIFDVTTVAPAPGAQRCIGDVLADAVGLGEVVGFENHGGRTYLGPGARPFARVRHGYGNNGDDGTEGAVYREAIGTYLHGSLLPKNPSVTDRLILAALRHRYGSDLTFEPLPADTYAERAHAAAATVARQRGRRNP